MYEHTEMCSLGPTFKKPRLWLTPVCITFPAQPRYKARDGSKEHRISCDGRAHYCTCDHEVEKYGFSASHFTCFSTDFCQEAKWEATVEQNTGQVISRSGDLKPKQNNNNHHPMHCLDIWYAWKQRTCRQSKRTKNLKQSWGVGGCCNPSGRHTEQARLKVRRGRNGGGWLSSWRKKNWMETEYD